MFLNSISIRYQDVCVVSVTAPYIIVQAYGGETVNYDYNGQKGKCKPGKDCGHYTQVRRSICQICIIKKRNTYLNGVYLSKILGGQIKIFGGGGAEGGKSDKCMGISQSLGARARAAPPQSLRL